MATARILEEPGGREMPSTNRIAKVAGVSIGTLYQYFDSREAIIRALARQHAGEMMELITAHAGALLDAPPAAAVPTFVEAMCAAHVHSPRLHLALVREMLADGGELLAELQDPSRTMVRVWLERHRDVVRPRDLGAATFLLTQTVEAAIHGQLFDDPARLADPAWRAELVDLLLRYLVRDP